MAQVASLGPIERYEAWRGSNGIDAEFTVESQEQVATATGKYRVGKGRSQWFEMTSGGQTERFYQSGSDTYYEFPAEGAYIESHIPSRMGGPPGEAGLAQQLFFPVFLQQTKLGWLLNEKGWAVQPPERVGDVLCDVLLGSNKPDAPGGTVVAGHLDHRVWIDPVGRIRRWEYSNNSPRGVLKTTFEFTKFAVTDWSLSGLPSPGEGMVPLFAPRRGEGIELGTTPELPECVDDSSQPFDLMREAKQGGLVVLFTRPDCEPSKAGSGVWQEAAERAAKQGIGFVEVVFSGVSDAPRRKWKRGWDRDGKVEDVVAPPGTPYLVRFDAKGMAVRAWFGYREDEGPEILDTLFK